MQTPERRCRRGRSHRLGSVEIWDSLKRAIVLQAWDGPICTERCPVGENGAALPGQEIRPWSQRRGQPAIWRGGVVDRANRQPLARSAAAVRPLEHRLQAVSRLGQSRCFQTSFRCRLGPARHGVRHGRRHYRQGPSPWTRRKRGTASQAIGRSKGGMTTKILALTDALGNLVRFVLLPGQRYDTVGIEPLIEGVEFGALIADKAFDSNDIIANLNQRGAKVVISQHPRRTTPLQIDTEMYKWRHLIENFFCKLKEFKRIAMRADKTDHSFQAMIHLVAAVINSR